MGERCDLRVLVMASCRWWNATAEGALLQARALSQAGVETMLAGAPGSPVYERASEAGIEALPVSLAGASFPAGLVELSGILRRRSPDFVCAHRSEDHAAAALVSRGIPLIRVRSDIRRPSISRTARMLGRRTALEVFSSPFMIRDGYARGRAGPVAVIPQPVDTDRFKPSSRASNGLIVMAARLSEVKGHRTMIAALAAVPRARLLIAGTPAQHTLEDLRSLAEAGGVADRVEFAGFIEDIGAVYAGAELGAVPSLASEAVSRAALEMMSCGLPVLAAATNGLVDAILDGRTGLLHPPGDSGTLARQISYLLCNRSVSDHLGRGARERCEKVFSLGAAGAEWKRLLAALQRGEQIRPRAGIIACEETLLEEMS